MFDPNTPLQRAPHTIDAPLEDSLVMLDPQRGKYYELNPVAARIWQLLAHPVSLNSIIATLQQEFDITPETCTTETTAFLNHIIDLGIVTTSLITSRADVRLRH